MSLMHSLLTILLQLRLFGSHVVDNIGYICTLLIHAICLLQYLQDQRVKIHKELLPQIMFQVIKFTKNSCHK